MKTKKIFTILMLATICLIFVALGAQAIDYPEIGGNVPGTTLEGYVRYIYLFALSIVGIAATITSKDEAKKWIWGAITGVILALAAYLILYTINPDLVSIRRPTLTPIENNTNNSESGTTNNGNNNPVYYEWTMTPLNKYCRDVLFEGWVNVADSFCQGNAPGTGYSCCRSFILAVGGFFVYNSFFKTTAETTENQDEETLSLSSKITAISQEIILDPVINGQKIRYYLANNGQAYESNFDGSGLTQLSADILTNLSKVLWSPDRNKVIHIFNDNKVIKKYLYDFKINQSTRLNQNIGYISWAPNKDRIVYQYHGPTGENNISISNPDGLDWTNIFPTRMKDLIVKWPSSNKIALITEPSGLIQGTTYTLNLTNNDFQKVIEPTYGLTTLWSPQANKLLFSETDHQGKNLKLKIADLEQSTINQLDIVTLPEKCIWSTDNQTVFCAIPEDIPQIVILPDDYHKNLTSFSDHFWKINVDTGQKIKIFENKGEQIYDAKNLLLSPLENYLIFVNQTDDLLYSLEI